MSSPITENDQQLLHQWRDAWPDALNDWSRYTQLHEPSYCFTVVDEKQESLSGSFAMIRLVDHSVVISLRQIRELGLQAFGPEILAHEIGHHVYCPSDLTDNARMLARMRRGLPGCEAMAPMIANLYADLLINDRLQRSCGRNMAGVYQALKSTEPPTRLWLLYLRTYELLWNLPTRSLTRESIDQRINQDALLGSRLVRNYSRDWLSGAGRFACLYFPYVVDDAEKARQNALLWGDTLQAGANGCPDGLSELEDDELRGAIHPAEDPILSGLDPIDLRDIVNGGGMGRVAGKDSGRKTLKSFRDPFEYAEILKASGVNLNEREIAVRYYRERAIPYLIPFPSCKTPVASDPHPEGLDVWDLSSDFDRIDWINTFTASPTVIPGVTTRERLTGTSPGSEPETVPFDLYLGVDCSGSMGDPAYSLSYPVLSGAVIALSALRAGAKVKVVLSGEPGRSVSTDGFIKNQADVLKSLVNYLGTGYSFGIHRLEETFRADIKLDRPVHILIVSDYDMFQMLDETGSGREGWEVAREAAIRSGGGATYVLQIPGYSDDVKNSYSPKIDRMQADGWHVHLVNSMEEILTFARKFSREQYHATGRKV